MGNGWVEAGQATQKKGMSDFNLPIIFFQIKIKTQIPENTKNIFCF